MFDVYTELRTYGPIDVPNNSHLTDEFKFTIIRTPLVKRLIPSYKLNVNGTLLTVLHERDEITHRRDTERISPIAESLLTPPAQDSTHHILNILPDDCFREIFKYLDGYDLCTAARCCTQFRAYSHPRLGKKMKKESYSREYREKNIELWRFDDILYNFGHTIPEYTMGKATYAEQIIIGMIANYCIGLKQLTIRLDEDMCRLIDYNRFFGIRFKRRLKMRTLKLVGGQNCEFRLPPIPMPGLERLVITNISLPNDRQTKIFFWLNPQLKSLVVDYLDNHNDGDGTYKYLNTLRNVGILVNQTPQITDAVDVGACSRIFNFFSKLRHIWNWVFGIHVEEIIVLATHREYFNVSKLEHQIDALGMKFGTFKTIYYSKDGELD